MFKTLLVGLLAIGFVFGGVTAVAAKNAPDAGIAITDPGTGSETGKNLACQYANEFAYMFANKGELKGPFLNRFAQMFERATGCELNDLPVNANEDARTPAKTRQFSGEQYPVTTMPTAKGK